MENAVRMLMMMRRRNVHREIFEHFNEIVAADADEVDASGIHSLSRKR
jgi:hypothetical protein